MNNPATNAKIQLITARSKRIDSPVIEDNVIIGAGAKVIGNIRIGVGARIGANCVVVNDVPANTTAVLQPPRMISQIND